MNFIGVLNPDVRNNLFSKGKIKAKLADILQQKDTAMKDQQFEEVVALRGMTQRLQARLAEIEGMEKQ